MLLVIGTCLVLAQLVFADIRGLDLPCGQCLCGIPTANVQIIKLYGGKYLGRFGIACFKFTGLSKFNFVSIDYRGDPGSWSPAQFLVFGPDNKCTASTGEEIQALEGICLCLKSKDGGPIYGSNAPTREGDVSTTLKHGQCYKTIGQEQRVQADDLFWFKLNLNPDVVWVPADYLTLSCVQKCNHPCHDVGIIARADWGATDPTQTIGINKPVHHLIIHHTDTDECESINDCKRIVKSFQDYHINHRDLNDIGFNFLIGGDCQVYEGPGWDNEGQHTQGYDKVSYGIAFIGTFDDNLPSDCMLETAKMLIECGVESGNIAADYSLAGQRDAVCSTSPGDALYEEISTYNNWHTIPIPAPSGCKLFQDVDIDWEATDEEKE